MGAVEKKKCKNDPRDLGPQKKHLDVFLLLLAKVGSQMNQFVHKLVTSNICLSLSLSHSFSTMFLFLLG